VACSQADRRAACRRCRHVSTAGQFAVDVDVVDGGVAGVLVAHAVDAVVEVLRILLGPPVIEVTDAVELAAMIVESVSQFMADRSSGVAVVRRIIKPRIVVRRLQNPSGKVCRSSASCSRC